MNERGLYILMISVHGLVRAEAPELGRDPDTGGQVLYVLELAKALARHADVAQVDLLTRRIEDPAVGPDYARLEEPIAPSARILRLPCGPRRYIRKELLWDHLDDLVDNYLVYARSLPRLPDLLHSHYADAGYVAMHLSNLLGIPFVHSGHSLGRCKKASLLQTGGKEAHLERTFHFSRRIPVEEEVLANAAFVITSTRQEMVEQYGLYENFDPNRAVVIPPGTDLSRFTPPVKRQGLPPIAKEVDRFLKNPKKPMLLCIARPAPRKNLLGLVEAYGQHPTLRNLANLVVVGGTRADINDLDDFGRETWKDLLLAMDRYDLYGHLAIPKSHTPEDIPDLYRLAAIRRGLCVNPSHSETFGLTLIEAAATGLPLVATSSGGPVDIVANCRNGLLTDVNDNAAFGNTLAEALSDPRRWSDWSRNGMRMVRSVYTWEAHATKYLKRVEKLLRRERKRMRRELAAGRTVPIAPFLSAESVLILDLDFTMTGDREALAELMEWIRERRDHLVFGVATARKRESALWVLREWGADAPDVLVSSVGSEIHYGPEWDPDAGWMSHIRRDWRRDEIARVMAAVPGLRRQTTRRLGPFKLSYFVNPAKFPGLEGIRQILRSHQLRAKVVYSQSRYLDFLPVRASKGQAVRYLAFKWGFPVNQLIVAGDCGNDLDMLTGAPKSIVVANHSQELAHLRGHGGVYFATRPYAGGVLEGLEHFKVQPGARPAAALWPEPAPPPPLAFSAR